MGCSAKLNECIVFRGLGQRWFGDLGRSGWVGSLRKGLECGQFAALGEEVS
jgi:hypothetical protein